MVKKIERYCLLNFGNTRYSHISSKSLKSINKAFTLIELLVVIAILGVLAVIVLIVLNPTEKQAQARDTGRISSVAQLGRSLQAYYTQLANYPSTATWAQDLIDHGELSSFPSGIVYNSYSIANCTSFVQPAVSPTYCYNLDATNGALVYAHAESNQYTSKCVSPQEAYFVFSTSESRGGTVCATGEPTPWVSGSGNYVQ
jgi:prepilin-type N-terminal cleavage/methylation domain-containing protein